jgi:hypothetical protein
MKYDCEKTRDFIHEWARYITVHNGARDPAPIDPWEKGAIERIQKWSDTHPEPPKIRKEDLAFIKAFKIRDSKYIERHQGHLRVVTMYGSQEFEIWPSMFPFIEEGQHVGFPELLKLEVEE